MSFISVRIWSDAKPENVVTLTCYDVQIGMSFVTWWLDGHKPNSISPVVYDFHREEERLNIEYRDEIRKSTFHVAMKREN
jgi:hypothetical protein